MYICCTKIPFSVRSAYHSDFVVAIVGAYPRDMAARGGGGRITSPRGRWTRVHGPSKDDASLTGFDVKGCNLDLSQMGSRQVYHSFVQGNNKQQATSNKQQTTNDNKRQQTTNDKQQRTNNKRQGWRHEYVHA